MRGLWQYGVICAVLSVALPASAQTAKPDTASSSSTAAAPTSTVPTKTYSDPANGVAFQYPAVWKLSQQSSFYEPPSILQQDQPAQAVVSFSSEGNYYAKTNLSGLDFVYVVVPQSSQQACAKLVTSNPTYAAKPPDTVTINGTSFLHVAGSDAGMCHQVSSNVYGTFRKGSCFLFEGDIHTLCAGVVDGTRELTVSESKALARHLDSIMQSVTIGSPK